MSDKAPICWMTLSWSIAKLKLTYHRLTFVIRP